VKNLKKFNDFKYSNLLEKNTNIDPYDEEDWDEIDGHHTTFKIWIGGTSKEIRLLCFPTHIQKKSDNAIYIKDDRLNNIFKDTETNFEIKSKGSGISLRNCYIIDNDDYSKENIINFIGKYLKSRKSSCTSNIKKYNKNLDRGYDVDEDGDEELIDRNDIEKNIELLELLMKNIIEFIPTIKEVVDISIKENRL